MKPQYYLRAKKLILPSVYEALKKGNEPDRMKGALYILSDKTFGLIFVRCLIDWLLTFNAASYAMTGTAQFSRR